VIVRKKVKWREFVCPYYHRRIISVSLRPALLSILAMTDVPSVELLERFRRHDPAAEEELFRRYTDRLTQLARSRLSPRLSSRVDAEDVIQSAYRSFFLLASEGGVALQQSGDLWRLLVRITLRKVCRNVRRHAADCRNIDREQPWPEDSDIARESAALSREPSPEDAAALIDELRSLLEPLNRVQRGIVELRLQGHEIEAIAERVQRSARTVRRTLAGLGEELERRLREESATVETPAVAGATLLDYSDVLLRQQLGAGGMGKVYRATWRSRGTDVAVKLLRKPLRQHDRAIALFLQEAALLARLHYPGIVAVHGLGRLPDGGHFLVMDLVEGNDLARQISAGPVAIDNAVCWVREAALALAHAHQQGIVHCDLKPSNLLLDGAGHVHVTDFGLAHSLAGGPDRTAGGTEGYVAPELLDPSLGPISPRTDVYGLGAVLYALLVGQPPFDRTSPAALRPEVPDSVNALCQHCLEREPEKRFSSAAELAAAPGE
jgi:RNA polymerase sigma factor (sigma-70 family)